jgi:hypothetical protein
MPPGDVLIAASIITQSAPQSANEFEGGDLLHQLLGNRYADVEAIFPTRAESTSAMLPYNAIGHHPVHLDRITAPGCARAAILPRCSPQVQRGRYANLRLTP